MTGAGPGPEAPGGRGRALDRVAGQIAAGTRQVATAAIVLMTVLIVVEVGARGLFRTSTLVADEMAGYLLAVLAAFGLADSFSSASFIRVSMLGDRLRPAARRRLERGLLVAALFYAGFLAWRLWAFALASYLEDTRSIDFSRTPLWIPRGLMALGVTALVLQVLARVFQPGDPPEAPG